MSCCSIFFSVNTVRSLLCELLHVVSQRFSGEPLRDPQGTRKNSPAERQLEAFRRGMQMRAPAGLPSRRIWNHG